MARPSLSNAARKLIEAGRDGEIPGRLVQAQLRRRVHDKLARGAVVAAFAQAPPLLAAMLKAGTAVVATAGLAVGTWYALPSAPEAPPAKAVATERHDRARAPGATEARSATEPPNPTADPRSARVDEQQTREASPEPVASVRGVENLVKANDRSSTPRSGAAAAGGPQRRTAGITAPGSERPRASEASAPANRDASPEPGAGAAQAGAGVAEEIALLSRARAALQRGDLGRAQAALAEYDRNASERVMLEERAGMGVLVLCKSGNGQAGRQAASRFTKRWPSSPLAERIRAACASGKGSR